MKNAFKRNLKLLFIGCFATVMLAAGLLIGGLSSNWNARLVFGETQENMELYLPSSYLEYYSLSSPIDVYSDQDITAILQPDSLITFYNGKFTEYTKSSHGFTSLKQVKRFNNGLLISDNAIIYYLNISDGEVSELKDSENKTISGNFFDLNEKYLVTSFSTKACVYSIVDDTFTKLPDEIAENADKSICINSNDTIFYIKNTGELYKHLIKPSGYEALSTGYNNVSPEYMIVQDEVLYYTSANKVFKIDFTASTNSELTLNADANYKLGQLVSPVGLTFKNGNLLIADSSIGAVQEFKENNGALEFTGFAIAKDKTAFNRLTFAAKDIQSNEEFICVLDENKITVIKETDGEKTFENYLFSKLGFSPNMFALGKTSALLIKQAAATDNVCILDFATGKLSSKISLKDIYGATYQNGYFYVTATYSGGTMFKISESNLTITDSVLFKSEYIQPQSLFAVDVDDNVALYNKTERKMFIFNKTDEGAYDATQPNVTVAIPHELVKLQTDLNGNIYCLTSNNYIITVKDGELDSEAFLIKRNNNLAETSLNTAKSFAVSYAKKEVYLIFNGEEYILKTLSLGNVSLADIAVPSDFKTTSDTADINNLKIFEVTNNRNIYEVAANDGIFEYISRFPSQKDCYVLAAQTEHYYVLVGKQLVLVKKAHASLLDGFLFDAEKEVVFTATGVNMYYYPIITQNDVYCLTDVQSDIAIVTRLSKNTPVGVYKKFTFNKKDFYYASFAHDGKTVYGYIPCNFTTFELSQDFKRTDFYFRTVSKNNTVVFSNAIASVVFDTVSKDTKVKVFYTDDNTSYVEYSTTLPNGSTDIRYGYILSSDLYNDGWATTRTLIVVIIAGVSLLTSSLYFILRKKY